jgi:hypothetical protein
VLTSLREQTAILAGKHAKLQILPEQGQFLRWLTETIRPTRILELGVFTGYSTLCFALALNDIHNMPKPPASQEAMHVRRIQQLQAEVKKLQSQLSPEIQWKQTSIESLSGGVNDHHSSKGTKDSHLLNINFPDLRPVVVSVDIDDQWAKLAQE